MIQSRLLDMPTIAFHHDVAEKLPIHGDVRQLIRLHSNDHLQVRRAGIIPVDAFCLLGDGLPAVPDLLDSFFSGHGHVYALLSTYQKSTLRGQGALRLLFYIFSFFQLPDAGAFNLKRNSNNKDPIDDEKSPFFFPDNEKDEGPNAKDRRCE